MKKWILIVLIAGSSLATNGQAGASALIPVPLHLQEKQGVFLLTPGTVIIAAPAFRQAAGLLADEMRLSPPSAKTTRLNTNKIVFLQPPADDTLGNEGYRLDISPKAISISAQTVAGALKAIFTLLQLQQLQADIHAIPCASITDKPRFAYRGMHLDVSRNFYSVSFIKKYIDLMALYKFNTFHWHLTDGAGWRLQIKKYPLLTNTAAFRTHSDWKSWWTNGRQYAKEGEANAYGGYYTRKKQKTLLPMPQDAASPLFQKLKCPAIQKKSWRFTRNCPALAFPIKILNSVSAMNPPFHSWKMY